MGIGRKLGASALSGALVVSSTGAIAADTAAVAAQFQKNLAQRVVVGAGAGQEAGGGGGAGGGAGGVAQVPAAQVLRAAVREREQPPVRVLPRPQPVVSQSV